MVYIDEKEEKNRIDYTEFLSQAAFDKLQEELEYREGELRKEITRRVALARDEGDLKENGGYHAAKDEQGKNESRISELHFRLEKATVVDGRATNDNIVRPGKLIVAELNNSGREIKFILGSRDNADSDKGIDAYSPDSPLGKAIQGIKAPAEVSYKAPNGKDIAVKLISAENYV
ncbi:MAG: GreA/GreB family elongation factor [Candidatus Ancillula sp.]|nr:GreA/GreB family elongation factor [Candidatus Ancillula sp.]